MKFVVFTLDKERFAIDIQYVREVIDDKPVTWVPRMPKCILGVINLRGEVLPVVDLQQKLGMGVFENSKDTCIIVVDVNFDEAQTPIGFFADVIEEVTSVTPDQWVSTPKMGIGLPAAFVQGIINIDDENYLIVLDINTILSEAELLKHDVQVS